MDKGLLTTTYCPLSTVNRLFIPQRHHRVQGRGTECGIDAEKDADRKREEEG